MLLRVVEFSSGGYKRNPLNFENWCSGELSKIALDFSVKVIQKLMLSKSVSNRKRALE